MADSPAPLKRKQYQAELEPLQIQLNNVSRWLQHHGHRLVVLFEGRDTSGKGGVINAIAESLNPRRCRVVALPKPSEREQGEWYFQRYITQLPSAGEMCLFDRSWYNRAGVERVMGWCSEHQYKRFLEQTPAFEKQLVDDGFLLLKYWLCVDQAEQEERFEDRAEDPLKRWKLSPIDLCAREKYDEYTDARDAMLRATHTAHAPWTLVDFNDQKRGRLALIRHLLEHIPDVRLPDEPLQLPPLKGKPKRERFATGLTPING